MPEYTKPDNILDQILAAVTEIRQVVLDLQERQKKMDARQQAIKKEIDEIEQSPVAQPVGSFATGYQAPKKDK